MIALLSQYSPMKPTAHVHVKEVLSLGLHVPPFWHGYREQGSELPAGTETNKIPSCKIKQHNITLAADLMFEQ